MLKSRIKKKHFLRKFDLQQHLFVRGSTSTKWLTIWTHAMRLCPYTESILPFGRLFWLPPQPSRVPGLQLAKSQPYTNQELSMSPCHTRNQPKPSIASYSIIHTLLSPCAEPKSKNSPPKLGIAIYPIIHTAIYLFSICTEPKKTPG
jgi:hypothetical protein